MSSYNPPIYYFSGIGFNSAFYTFMTGLTQSQANALYLQKTTADTATAVETFASGIISNTVDVPTTNGILNLGVTSTTGIVNIATATGRTGAMNIGTGTTAGSVITMGGALGTINLNGTSQVFSAPQSSTYEAYGGGLQIANSVNTGSITLGQNMTSGSIYIGANSAGTTARTGIIHIGDSNNLLTAAAVNISNGTANGSTVNMMNGSTTTGTCNIMSGAGATGIINLLTSTANGGTVNIASGTNGVGSNTTAVNISTGTTTGSVGIGNTSNITTISGIVKMPNLSNNYVFRTPTVSQAITSGIDSTVLFNTLVSTANNVNLSYNSGVFTNSNTYSITCQIAYTIAFPTNSTGFRNARINCSAYTLAVGYLTLNPSTTTETLLSSSSVLVIPASGTFNISCYQNCGGPLSLDQNATSVQILVL